MPRYINGRLVSAILGETVSLSTAGNTIKIDGTTNTVKLDQTGVASTVKIDGTTNTVKIDGTTNTIKIDGTTNTVKIDGTTNTVKVQDVGTWAVGALYTAEVVNDGAVHTSAAVELTGFSAVGLELNIAVTLTPTDLTMELQFSDNTTDWYPLATTPWSNMVWEDGGAPYMESHTIPLVARYVRLSAVGTGCDANNYFTITAKLTLRT